MKGMKENKIMKKTLFVSVLLASGLLCAAGRHCDNACPSEGVYRAYSAVQGERVLTVDPEAKHCGTWNHPFLQLMGRYR